MALIIETGLQVANSESYISAADATTYHTNRGNTAWTGTDAVKEAALRRAAAYLDGHYRKRWKGQPVKPITQSMAWPRVGVKLVDVELLYYDVAPSYYDSELMGFVPITTIPQRLKDAQCELALRALAGDLAADGESNIIREKVDVLETEYAPNTVKGKVVYPLVDSLLSDLLKPIGSSDALRG
jgi:hypothetical protein